MPADAAAAATAAGAAAHRPGRRAGHRRRPRRRLAPTPGAEPAARGAAAPASTCAIVLVLLLLWVAYLVAVPLYAWTKVDKVDFEPSGDRPADQPGTTYLMVGSDSRAGLTKEQRKEYAHRQRGRAAHRHDHAAAHRLGPNLLMSIPRDSLVEIPGPRHHQDQRRLRVRRAEAAGEDHRAEHRHPDRPVRRDRPRRRRRAWSTPSAASRSARRPR